MVADMAALQGRAGSPGDSAHDVSANVGPVARRRQCARGSTHGFGGLIILFERLGRAADAVTLHEALMHYLPSLQMQEELPAAIERARASLDDATFDAALRRGTAMDFRDMTDFARGEN